MNPLENLLSLLANLRVVLTCNNQHLLFRNDVGLCGSFILTAWPQNAKLLRRALKPRLFFM